ncbi:autotransporter domain-containing protein [Bradyrhizobium sp. SRS-191]|uniref:autotransporter domain-containing protein n=1 Tax=Bradyrhizobium sp. SRS-191 TaxID=2962606 RepID=UPI0027BAAD70|nr:autotransporter domain-containing protein [Bradyrhizobium sp. SRS-191]
MMRRPGLAVQSFLGTTALVLSLAIVTPALAGGGSGNGLTTGAAGGADSALGAGGSGSAGTTENSYATGGGGGGAGVTGGAGGVGFDHDGNGAAGGAGGATAGANGANGSDAPTGAMGGGGGGGGAHGAVVTTAGSLASVSGGNGGNGGNGPPGFSNGGWIGGGGGGGAGGYGTVVSGIGLTVNNSSGTITAGNGGNGGNGGVGGSAGGDGGSGGIGLYVTGGSNGLNNSGTISGGNGGAGGAIFTRDNGERAGNGGAGGAGIAASGGLTIFNTGTITGGNGGAAGSGGGGTAGAGGVGITGADLVIFNSGTISGGLSGDGTTRANAITFTGGVNGLQLIAGSSIIGNVTAYSRSDSINLTGATNGSFDLSSIGTQYLGFGRLAKSGTGTWTVSGTNSTAVNWEVAGGTLQLASGAVLGASSGSLTVSGGTLNLGATTQTQNGGVTLTGGTIQNGTLSSSGTFLLQSGVVAAALAGSGDVYKNGTGTVILTGPNSYTGGTTVAGGTLQLGGSSTLGAISNSLAVSAGTLDLGGTAQTQNGGVTLTGGTIASGTLSSSATFALQSGTVNAALAGQGRVSKTGSGFVMLSGANSYTGGTTVSAGWLQLNGSATLGATSNTLEVSGGTLDLGGTTQTQNGGVSLTGGTIANGTLSSNASFDLQSGAVSASLAGTGGVSKTGSGTVTLSGANSYTGGTTISAGTLELSGSGTLGAISNTLMMWGGTLDLGGTSQTQNGGVSLSGGTIANGTLSSNASFDLQSGTVSAALAGTGGVSKTGTGTVTLSGASNYTGGTTITAGTLQLGGSGTLGAAGGTLAMWGGLLDLGGTVQTQNGGVSLNGGTIANGALASSGSFALQSGTVSASLSGTGSAVKSGSGRVVLSGVNNYTGTTTINGGILQVDGSIAASSLTTINAGGTLSGTGTVGHLLVASGGTFTPGSGSVGSSMTVSGNLAFQSGALYIVQVDPTTSSFATVAGTATLEGATVSASFAAGSYIEKRYTILTATGGLSGTFASGVVTTSLPASFATSLSYDATHAYLDLALAFAPPSGSGFSANQQGVGNTIINYFNKEGRIPRAFGGLTAAGLTQLSGEQGTSPQSTSVDAMGQFAGMLMDPTAAGRGGSPGGGALGYASDPPARKGDARDAMASLDKARPASFAQRWAVWASGFGGGQSTDGNAAAGSSNSSSRIYGTAVGLDYLIGPHTIAGFALAGGGTNFNVGTLGSGRSDLFQAGAFVRHAIGPAYLSAALAYGWQHVTSDRIVAVSGVDRLRAQFNTNTWSGRLEAGYRVATPWFGGLGMTPYTAVQLTRIDLPAYAEQVLSGSGTFALNYASQSVTDTRSELGLRSDKSFAVVDGVLTLRGRAAWAHDFNPSRTAAATFQALPGASFVVNGAAGAKDAGLITASAEMGWLNGWSTTLTFDGEFSNVSRSYLGKGMLRYAW